MILSRHLGFVFVKAHKVGGTSVEMALSTICEHPDDIITPITPLDEQARLAMGGVPRNFSKSKLAELAYVNRVKSATRDELDEISPEGLRFRNHMTLAKLASKVDITGLRTVGIVRSPFGIVVSWANHRIGFQKYRRSGERMMATQRQIQKVVDEAIAENKLGDKGLSEPYRGKDGTVAIEALRHERLEQDFTTFVQSLGVSRRVDLPFAKQGMGLTADQAADLLRPDQRQAVRAIFAEDIANFGDGLSLS